MNVNAASRDAVNVNVSLLIVTNLCSFSKSESHAETFQPAVRVDHHIGDRIIWIGVLQRGNLM